MDSDYQSYVGRCWVQVVVSVEWMALFDLSTRWQGSAFQGSSTTCAADGLIGTSGRGCWTTTPRRCNMFSLTDSTRRRCGARLQASTPTPSSARDTSKSCPILVAVGMHTEHTDGIESTQAAVRPPRVDTRSGYTYITCGATYNDHNLSSPSSTVPSDLCPHHPIFARWVQSMQTRTVVSVPRHSAHFSSSDIPNGLGLWH